MRNVSVAVPIPYLDLLTYHVPDGIQLPPVGARVRVPIGTRVVTGCVVDYPAEAPSGDLKDVIEVIDREPLLPSEVVTLCRWVADYYPVEVLEDDGSIMRFEFSAPDPAVAANLLLRLGNAGRLVSGEEVGEALTSLRGRLLEVYRPRPTGTKND